MLKVLLSGCNGKMGHVVADICASDDSVEVVCGLDISAQSDHVFPVYTSVDEIQEACDVAIDFSNPRALDALLPYCVAKKLPLVVCTTGHSGAQELSMAAAAKDIALFKSGNMTIGINLIAELLKRTAQVLGDGYDVEIIERHHNRKLDAPSGTALMLADAVAQGLAYEPEYIYDRHSERRARGKHEIGMHSVRGGTIVGEHEVIFAGRDEIIEIKHTILSREVFAVGAVGAAKFLYECEAPGIYNMNDYVVAKANGGQEA